MQAILKKNKSKVVFSELVVLDFIVKLEIEICAILLLKFYVKITWGNQLHFFCWIVLFSYLHENFRQNIALKNFREITTELR